MPLAKQGLYPAAVQGVLLAMPPSPWHTQVPQAARPRSPECPEAGTHCQGMQQTLHGVCPPARLPMWVLRGSGTFCTAAQGDAVLAWPCCPALPKGWFAHPQPLPGAQCKAQGGIRPPCPQLLLPGLAPAWEPQLSVTGAMVRGSGAGTAAGVRAEPGRRAGLRGNASPSAEKEHGCMAVATEKEPDCG